MPMVFMRHSVVGTEPDFELCPSVFRFEPIGSRAAALAFLSPNGDPYPTSVGLAPQGIELGEWLVDGAQHDFQAVFTCGGNAVKDCIDGGVTAI